MKNIKNFFTQFDSIINIFIGVFIMAILGYSAITSTPILQITSFDSQWWILFLVVIMWSKNHFGKNEK
jgi:heme O synthase-like polyprenyltransferase